MNSIQLKAVPHTARHRTSTLALTSFMAVAFLTGFVLTTQAQTVTTLYTFSSNNNTQPIMPFGTMAQGRDGAFYGISQSGNGCCQGWFYKVDSTGAQTPLHAMTSAEGTNCNGLTLGTDGNFYGTCFSGGTNSFGTLFKATPNGTVTVLHNWNCATDGGFPLAPPIQGSDGSFYGTTYFCGGTELGRVYKYTLAGKYTSLYSFKGPPTDVQNPHGLVQGSDGNFWGMGDQGGVDSGNGGVFKITPAGIEKVVYTFMGGTDGQNPYTSLIQGSDGSYYGTTEGGGGTLDGTIFKLTPNGVEKVLYNFSDQTEGAFPRLPLTQGPDGLLWGIATDCIGGGCSQAGIFTITTMGVYDNIYLYPIIEGNNNSLPYSPLLLSTDGTFYSVTEGGGSKGVGTFYSVSTTYAPFISLVNVRSGEEGAQIGILGQGFSASSVVKFGGTVATTTQRTGNTFIQATVPPGALTGKVTVTTGATTLSTNAIYKIIPQVITFSPASGTVGTVVTITGTGLKQATSVKFNGKAAVFAVHSDTNITATVPAGATSGTISVTTKGGEAASSAKFTVN